MGSIAATNRPHVVAVALKAVVHVTNVQVHVPGPLGITIEKNTCISHKMAYFRSVKPMN